MSLNDPLIPMWTVKHKGQTYYVNHMDVLPGIGFSTKETPNNIHTKGSLKIKGSLRIEEIENQIIATAY